MGQIIKSLLSICLSVCLSLCPHSYSHNFCLILMKFCTVIWGPKNKNEFVRCQNPTTPFPFLPKFFTPIMQLQWEDLNTIVTRHVDRLWLLRAQTMCLGSGYMHKVAKCCNPNFVSKTKSGDQYIFSGNILGYVFDTSYLSNSARESVKGKPYVAHLMFVWPMTSRDHVITCLISWLQCVDAVGWATGRASSLEKILAQQCSWLIIVEACCLQVRNTVIVIGGMLPWSQRIRQPTQPSPCSWPIIATWWQHAVPSQEHCHPSVLRCLAGWQERHQIRSVIKVLPH